MMLRDQIANNKVSEPAKILNIWQYMRQYIVNDMHYIFMVSIRWEFGKLRRAQLPLHEGIRCATQLRSYGK